MTVEKLKEFWNKTCSEPVSEQDAKQTAMARKEFVKQSDKLQFEGGFKEEFFRKLPNYLFSRDSYEVNLFMKMCPSATTSEEIQAQIDKFNGMLKKYTLVPEEQDLLRAKINKLSIELRISKNNTSNKLIAFKTQAKADAKKVKAKPVDVKADAEKVEKKVKAKKAKAKKVKADVEADAKPVE